MRLSLIVLVGGLAGLALTGRVGVAEAAAPKVCLQPLGPHDKALLGAVERGISFLYGFQTAVLPARALPELAFYKPRKRWRAEKLLDWMDSEVLPAARQSHGCDKIMGFTRADISTTKDPFEDWGILGLGNIGGTSGVVSSFRSGRGTANRSKIGMRTVKVMNHELGHVLGLHHGGAPGCIMNDAQGTVKTVDHESGLLCDNERAEIARLHSVSLPTPASFDWKTVLATRAKIR